VPALTTVGVRSAPSEGLQVHDQGLRRARGGQLQDRPDEHFDDGDDQVAGDALADLHADQAVGRGRRASIRGPAGPGTSSRSPCAPYAAARHPTSARSPASPGGPGGPGPGLSASATVRTSSRSTDSLGLFAEAVSVYVQVGGRLDERTWSLVRRLADQITADDPGHVKQSNGIWEMRTAQPLVDGDIGRWLLLERALWIARLAALDPAQPLEAGTRHHPQPGPVRDRRRRPAAAGVRPTPSRPDASALMAVAFGLLSAEDPRAGRLVDALLTRLGAGPYPVPARSGRRLPRRRGRVPADVLPRCHRVGAPRPHQDAEQRLDRLCGRCPGC